MSAPWSAIGVPIDSVGRGGGTEHAPAAVREHDLPARLGAEDRGDLDVRIHGEERDRATGVIGIADTLATTRAVRAAVRDLDHLLFSSEVQTACRASFDTRGLKPLTYAIGAQRALKNLFRLLIKLRNVERTP